MGDVLSGELKNIAKREHRICPDKSSMVGSCNATHPNPYNDRKR